jgi:hypothetical protein
VLGVDGKLFPNTAAALVLQDVRAWDALYVERYWRYWHTFIKPEVWLGITGEDRLPRLQDNPMFDTLGIRAILSSRDMGTVRGLRMLGRDRDTRVYENTNAYPRAWVVHMVHVVAGEDEAFALLKARSHGRDGAFIVDSFDPRREAVIEHSGKTVDETLRGLQGTRNVCTSGDSDRAIIQRYSGNSVSLRVNAACPGLLVLPDTYFPGWTATVNGRAQTIYPTDGAFRGVTVPGGISNVEFRYEPRTFSVGVVVALAGMTAFVLILLASVSRNRKRTGTSTAERAHRASRAHT